MNDIIFLVSSASIIYYGSTIGRKNFVILLSATWCRQIFFIVIGLYLLSINYFFMQTILAATAFWAAMLIDRTNKLNLPNWIIQLIIITIIIYLKPHI